MGQELRVSMDGLLPGAELFHATEHLLPPFRQIPTVLTVHDLIFERLPEHHKFFNRHYLKAAMPSTAAALTPSLLSQNTPRPT